VLLCSCLEGVLRDVEDDAWKEAADVAPGAHHADQPLQPVQLLARVGAAQCLVQLAPLLLDLKLRGCTGMQRGAGGGRVRSWRLRLNAWMVAVTGRPRGARAVPLSRPPTAWPVSHSVPRLNNTNPRVEGVNSGVNSAVNSTHPWVFLLLTCFVPPGAHRVSINSPIPYPISSGLTNGMLGPHHMTAPRALGRERGAAGAHPPNSLVHFLMGCVGKGEVTTRMKLVSGDTHLRIVREISHARAGEHHAGRVAPARAPNPMKTLLEDLLRARE